MNSPQILVQAKGVKNGRPTLPCSAFCMHITSPISGGLSLLSIARSADVPQVWNFALRTLSLQFRIPFQRQFPRKVVADQRVRIVTAQLDARVRQHMRGCSKGLMQPF